MKLLLYCTKSKPYLLKGNHKYLLADNKHIMIPKEDYCDGKIVAECDYEIEEIEHKGTGHKWYYFTKKLNSDMLTTQSCLNRNQILVYLGNKSVGYAIHIKNLNIFDKPRGLSGYSKRIGNYFQVLGNAPQNMMKCCEIKYFIKDYILISIRPEWLVKILNGEQTILVKKKVLKEML